MQVYLLKMFNFFRFRENNNCIVFDLLEKEKEWLSKNNRTLDDLYNALSKPANLIKHVQEVNNNNNLCNLMSIVGVVGDNYDKSNGTGKSTILEAMSYAFYEQVVRKNVNTDKIEKATTSVITKFNNKYPDDLKESFVEIFFVEKNKIYRLKRGRKLKKDRHEPFLEFECINETINDSLTSHRTSSTNEEIQKIINMDYDLFCSSIMFGQSDAGKFLIGTDKVRKEMIVNMLGLDKTIGSCLQRIRDLKNAKVVEMSNLESQIQIITDMILNKKSNEELEKEINNYKEKTTKCDLDIGQYRKEIDELSRSNILQEIEIIKQQGTQIKNDLISKKNIKEEQINQWKILSNETVDKEKKSDSKKYDISKKITECKKTISVNKILVENFDLNKQKEDLDKVEKAKSVKNKYNDKLNEIRQLKEKNIEDVGIQKNNLNRIKEELEGLEKQLKSAEKTGKEEFLCDKCKSIVSKKHIEEEISKFNQQLKSIQELINVLLESSKSIVLELKDQEDKVEKINNWLIKENKIKLEISQFENNKNKIDENEKQLSELEKQLLSTEEEIASLKVKKDEYEDKIKQISKQYDDDIQSLQNKITELGNQYKSKQSSADEINVKIDSLKKNIDKITLDKTNFDSQLGSIKKEIETISENKKKLEELKDILQKETVLSNQYLILENIFGLDGIQSRVVKKYIPFFNFYIKEILDVLTLGKMQIEISINNKDKIDILITGGTADNFSMLSGGEKMLCRLAVDIGLARLSFARSSQKPEIICLDEIFGPLDNEHTEAVFRLLKKLQDKFNRVLIISHKPEINDMIKNKILVEKEIGDEGCSKVIKII